MSRATWISLSRRIEALVVRGMSCRMSAVAVLGYGRQVHNIPDAGRAQARLYPEASDRIGHDADLDALVHPFG